MDNNLESITRILEQLKKMKIPTSKIERDLGFSNGLLKKGKLSGDKWEKLVEYYEEKVNGGEIIYIYKIYKLINPINNKIFYVGNTRQDVDYRLYCHIVESKNHRQPIPSKKHSEILSIISIRETPIVEILEQIEDNSLQRAAYKADEAEKKWILLLREQGHTLTNRTPAKEKTIIIADAVYSNYNTKKESSQPKWVKEIEDACNIEGITPQELIGQWKMGKKKAEKVKPCITFDEMQKGGLSKWQLELRKKKLGL